MHWSIQFRWLRLLRCCKKSLSQNLCLFFFQDDYPKNGFSVCLDYPEILKKKLVDKAVCRQQATELIINLSYILLFFSIVARGPLIYCYNLHTIINILSFSYYCYIYIHFMRFSGKPKAIQGPYWPTDLVCAELSKFIEGMSCRWWMRGFSSLLEDLLY